MTYTPGEVVVHPQHGTAIVQGIVTKDVGSGSEDYLELYVETRSMKVLVPVEAAKAGGIRALSTKVEAEEILAILEAPSDVPERWSERNASTISRVKSHDLGQISMVIRDLCRLQLRRDKPLTMGERNSLEGCIDTVARELSLALGMSEEDTRALIVERSLTGRPSGNQAV